MAFVILLDIVIQVIRFGPFIGKEGELVDTVILERNLFSSMEGIAVIKGKQQSVKIIFASIRFIPFCMMYSKGDHCTCFQRKEGKKDIVVLYF